MGLDAVELVLAVEDEFAIAVDDEHAENITTPRQFADYVVGRLGAIAPSQDRCLSQAGFYRIRSVLVRNFGARRKDVRLDAPIRQFLNGDIRIQWKQFKKETEAIRLPRLKCRRIIFYPLMVGMPLIGAALSFLFLNDVRTWLLYFAVALSLLGLAVAMTSRLADLIPANLQTIRSLVPYVRGIENRAEWTPDYVLQRIIQITSEQLGIPIEKVLPDSHFVEDLGMG